MDPSEPAEARPSPSPEPFDPLNPSNFPHVTPKPNAFAQKKADYERAAENHKIFGNAFYAKAVRERQQRARANSFPSPTHASEPDTPATTMSKIIAAANSQEHQAAKKEQECLQLVPEGSEDAVPTARMAIEARHEKKLQFMMSSSPVPTSNTPVSIAFSDEVKLIQKPMAPKSPKKRFLGMNISIPSFRSDKATPNSAPVTPTPTDRVPPKAAQLLGQSSTKNRHKDGSKKGSSKSRKSGRSQTTASAAAGPAGPETFEDVSTTPAPETNGRERLSDRPPRSDSLRLSKDRSSTRSVRSPVRSSAVQYSRSKSLKDLGEPTREQLQFSKSMKVLEEDSSLDRVNISKSLQYLDGDSTPPTPPAKNTPPKQDGASPPGKQGLGISGLSTTPRVINNQGLPSKDGIRVPAIKIPGRTGKGLTVDVPIPRELRSHLREALASACASSGGQISPAKFGENLNTDTANVVEKVPSVYSMRGVVEDTYGNRNGSPFPFHRQGSPKDRDAVSEKAQCEEQARGNTSPAQTNLKPTFYSPSVYSIPSTSPPDWRPSQNKDENIYFVPLSDPEKKPSPTAHHSSKTSGQSQTSDGSRSVPMVFVGRRDEVGSERDDMSYYEASAEASDTSLENNHVHDTARLQALIGAMKVNGKNGGDAAAKSDLKFHADTLATLTGCTPEKKKANSPAAPDTVRAPVKLNPILANDPIAASPTFNANGYNMGGERITPTFHNPSAMPTPLYGQSARAFNGGFNMPPPHGVDVPPPEISPSLYGGSGMSYVPDELITHFDVANKHIADSTAGIHTHIAQMREELAKENQESHEHSLNVLNEHIGDIREALSAVEHNVGRVTGGTTATGDKLDRLVDTIQTELVDKLENLIGTNVDLKSKIELLTTRVQQLEKNQQDYLEKEQAKGEHGAIPSPPSQGHHSMPPTPFMVLPNGSYSTVTSYDDMRPQMPTHLPPYTYYNGAAMPIFRHDQFMQLSRDERRRTAMTMGQQVGDPNAAMHHPDTYAREQYRQRQEQNQRGSGAGYNGSPGF